MKKKLIINGVDLKIELLIALSIIPFFLIFSCLSLFLYKHFTDIDYKNIPFYILLGGMIFGIVIGLVFAKYLAKKLSSKWIIVIQEKFIEVKFKNYNWLVDFRDITKLQINGNSDFKYLSIYTNTQSIRMRIGNSGLTPFSAQEDLLELDRFISEISPHFEQEYRKIDKTKKLSPPNTVKLTYLKN